MASNWTLHHTDLMDRITAAGRKAAESRQISRRLVELLPLRLRDIKSRYRRRYDDWSATRAERLALSDAEYIGYVEEVALLKHQAISARIEYETLMLVFEARRSLRRSRF